MWPEGGRVRPSTTKTILFWSAMILLAVLLWKMASTPSQQPPTQPFTSTELEAQINSKNIRSARITVYRDRSLIVAEKRDTPARFQTYVSNDFVPRAVQQLEENGADVWIQSAAAAENNWTELLVDVVPFILLILMFVFILKQRQTRSRRDPPPQGRPIDV